MRARAGGATLIVGLMLLSLVTLLALSGASTARIEARLAQNERFRENAAAAASAGIEFAIRRIATASDLATVPPSLNASLPASDDRYEAAIRLAGFELSLPQAPGMPVVGAHFEIVSTGRAARRSVDRQRATVMRVVESSSAVPLPCDAPRIRCHRAGEMVRTGWHRVPVD